MLYMIAEHFRDGDAVPVYRLHRAVPADVACGSRRALSIQRMPSAGAGSRGLAPRGCRAFLRTASLHPPSRGEV